MKTALNLPIYGAGDLDRYYRLMTAGQFYNSIKDFSTAADRYREALAMHERILGVDNSGILDPMMHLALEMSNQGRFAEADLLFDRVGVLARRALDRNDHARYWSYRALHAANMQDFEAALDFARRATRLRKEIAQGQPGLTVSNVDETARREDRAILAGAETASIVDIIQSLYVESAMLQRLGRMAEAEEALAEAKRILRRAHEMPPSWEPELLGLSARIAKTKGADAERSQYLTTAGSLWQQFAPGERPSVINYLKLGESNLAEGRKDDAMQAFRQAISLVKSQGGSLTYDQLQPFFRAGFERAESRPEERDRLYAEMFEAGQLVRSERTTHTIARAVARLAANEGEAGALVRDYQEAQDERLVLYRRFEEAVAQPETDESRARIDELKTKISELNRRIRDVGSQVQAAHPRYHQLVDSVVEAAHVIDLIKPGEALAQVLLGTNEGILFLVRDGKVRAFALDLPLPEAEEIVRELRTGLEPKVDGTLPSFNVALAHQLYQRLFRPALDDITVDHLITVPTGPLLSLPFGLLVTEKPPEVSGYDYRQVPWLLRRSAISLLP
ncbi:MAG: tetratricopeptide repeat protein, partial [Pseudomonadota bacterium]